MSKTTFTPGPWIIELPKHNKGSFAKISAQRWSKFASVVVKTTLGDGVYVKDDAGEANARLIAAAPEMYELLRQILEGNSTNFEFAKQSIQSLLNSINQ